MRLPLQTATVALGLWGASVQAIDVTWTDTESVKEAASTIAYGLMKYYTGNNTGDTPGNLPDPYYWWEAGAMFGTMIDYWWLTGDTTYNNVTSQAMIHQVGDDDDYMPSNQTLTEGNDDQGFWAMAAMSAAEHGFTNPPDTDPQWLALVQAVFNEYVSRWDTAHCDGGLRWQIFTFNTGYDYKNSISNGCFFNVAARLARYTGNDSYAEWATKVFEWEEEAGLMSENYNVYDGATIGTSNCSSIDTNQWTYNGGVFMYGAAVMYNYTGNSTWKTRLDGLVNTSLTEFTQDSVIYEKFCETADNCDTDAQTFKGYLARWMAATTQVASYTYDTIYPVLEASGKAAALACSGSPSSGFSGIAGTACGFTWLNSSFDGKVGVGPQMSSLAAVMYTLVNDADVPLTNSTGGTSKGDASAGNPNSDDVSTDSPITTGDRVGASIITILMCSGLVAGCLFLLSDL